MGTSDTKNSNFTEATKDCKINTKSQRQWCKVVQHPEEFTSESHIIQHSAGYALDEQNIEHLKQPYMGQTCHDTCEGDLTMSVTTSWHIDECDGASTNFDSIIPGTYVLKYECEDASKNSEVKCRTVINQDHAKPVTTVLEADEQTYEATRTDNYIDAGATCSDEVDKDISQDVEVSGDVVNLARVAHYTVLYNCMDSAMNKAEEATRQVWVVDSSCPICQMKVTSGTSGVDETIEGSFPYSDAGAVASDSLQGSFGICSTWSSAVTATNPDGTYQITPYDQIVNVEATGEYYITYRVKDSAGNWNDDTTCTGSQTGNLNVRTVTVVDTLKPVIALGFDENKVSHNVDHTPSQATSRVIITRGPSEDRIGDAPQQTYGQASTEHVEAADGSITSETGKVNPAGDWIDTHWGVAGTATNHLFPDTLMAEAGASRSANAWVLGAVASGVSGLALLGYAMKKQSAVTVVPV